MRTDSDFDDGCKGVYYLRFLLLCLEKLIASVTGLVWTHEKTDIFLMVLVCNVQTTDRRS